MTGPIEPRIDSVSVPLPKDADLPSEVLQRLEKLPPLNNLRMFANVPQCFEHITDLINALFNQGTIDPTLREYMYLRIAIKYGLYYEYRHNLGFARQLGMSKVEIDALHVDGKVDGLDEIGNLVCAAAEEITENLRTRDETLRALLAHFGREQTSEIILLVSWFNLLIRYVEATRVPCEQDMENLTSGGGPLRLD
ncbi:carboxymuconolactone decarboxylase family protein [Ruegeria arenilitoris]|uniref:carboxymuconolactone decarboxylase family protein n=1 Tax=Ruegeria arenilitoris TaxID=1173585 RepID=UPI00147B0B31|nr:hypothetical protein [Ruegeria arenilitoris]